MDKKPAKRPPRRLPLPWWIIWQSPAIEVATIPVYHAVCSLAVRYWISGCQPMPVGDAYLAVLARMRLHDFQRQRAAILASFEAIRIYLDDEHAIAVVLRAARTANANNARAIRDARRQMVKARHAAIGDQPIPPKTSRADDVEAVITTRTAPVVGQKPAMPSGTKLFRG